MGMDFIIIEKETEDKYIVLSQIEKLFVIANTSDGKMKTITLDELLSKFIHKFYYS